MLLLQSIITLDNRRLLHVDSSMSCRLPCGALYGEAAVTHFPTPTSNNECTHVYLARGAFPQNTVTHWLLRSTMRTRSQLSNLM